MFKLKNFENGELVQKNAVFMDYLQNGIPVRFFVNGEERSSIVYLIDYKKPDNGDIGNRRKYRMSSIWRDNTKGD